jgi:hypothetical protein
MNMMWTEWCDPFLCTALALVIKRAHKSTRTIDDQRTCKIVLSMALLTILMNFVAADGTHQRTRPPLVRM